MLDGLCKRHPTYRSWCFGGSVAVESHKHKYSVPYEEPWYTSRLPYLAYQSKNPALIQIEKFDLAFRLPKLS